MLCIPVRQLFAMYTFSGNMFPLSTGLPRVREALVSTACLHVGPGRGVLVLTKGFAWQLLQALSLSRLWFVRARGMNGWLWRRNSICKAYLFLKSPKLGCHFKAYQWWRNANTGEIYTKRKKKNLTSNHPDKKPPKSTKKQIDCF